MLFLVSLVDYDYSKKTVIDYDWRLPHVCFWALRKSK